MGGPLRTAHHLDHLPPHESDTMTLARAVPPAADIAAIARGSLDVILRFQDASGAYPASPTFSAYRGYSWFRDGAFIADAASAAGAAESADRFFDWCSRMLTDRADQVERIVGSAASGHPAPDAEMLDTRFTLDGRHGDADWWDFQLDGYGTWLWAVDEHARRHGTDLSRWSAGIELSVRYLLSSWRRPCFDWWEEHSEQVHVSTLGCIAAGLRAVAPSLPHDLGEAARAAVADILDLIESEGLVEGHLAKWLGSGDVDASALALVSPLRLYPAGTAIGSATVAAVAAELSVDGGVHRFAADTFYGGGQWPLLSSFLGLCFADAGDRRRAQAQLAWAAGTVTPEGELPEQVDDHLLFPERRQEWIDRWGTVATPLLWSHAMVLRLAVELGVEL